MDKELKQYMQKITEQLDALIKLIYANTDKKDLCQHLAVQDDFTSGVFTTTLYGGLKSFKIVQCINCGARFQQEAK